MSRVEIGPALDGKGPSTHEKYPDRTGPLYTCVDAKFYVYFIFQAHGPGFTLILTLTLTPTRPDRSQRVASSESNCSGAFLVLHTVRLAKSRKNLRLSNQTI